MATEQGIVIRTDSREAWVKTIKTGSCEGCSARGSCHSAGNRNEMEVNAINEAGAKVGDRIVLSFKTSSLLKASFLLYVFPILLLVTGAGIGQASAAYLNMNPSLLAAILGFALFFVAVLAMKLKADRLAKKDEYRPKIIKVLKN